MSAFSLSCFCLLSRKKLSRSERSTIVQTHTHALYTYASRSRFKLRSLHICHGTATAIYNQWRQTT